MRFALHTPLIAAIVAIAAPAVAQDAAPATAPAAAAPVVKSGRMVRTADGRRVGEIDRVIAPGTPSEAVSIIFDGGIVAIPAATLSDTGKGLQTSMTYADIRKSN